MAVAVHGHGADRVARGLPLRLAALGHVPVALDALDALACRERLRPRGHEQHVRGLLHHHAREGDRVAHPADRGHAARSAGAAAHDGCVVLDLAVLVQHRAAAGVEEGVILERDGRCLHCVERGAAVGQDLPARLCCRAQALVVGLLVWDRAACAAVDD